MSINSSRHFSKSMPRAKGCKDIPLKTRLSIIAFLELHLKPDGKLQRCAHRDATLKYGVCRNTVGAIWKHRLTAGIQSVRPGPSPLYSQEEFMAMVEAVPVEERTTVRSTAAAIRMSIATVQRYIRKRGWLRRRASRVKPALTKKHMLDRLSFVVSFVERPFGSHSLRFNAMYDVVHIDEKWFYIYKEKKTYILTRREQVPHRSCPNRRFITKVMFLAAVARPRYNYEKECGFDGKIGIFPIVEKRQAKRASKHHAKGDTIVQPVSVDKRVYADLLVKKVLPAIQAKWPGRKSGTIYLQQDNASPHVTAEEAIRESPLASYGWDVQILRQPAKSPDLNILDLGYFHIIQSLQYQKRAYTLRELMTAVTDSFRELRVSTLEKGFLTLQAVMQEVMMAKGSNNYQLPRVKRKHFPSGVFPASLPCSDEAFITAYNAIKRLETEIKNEAK